MKLLLVLRTVAVIVAIGSLAISFVTAGPVHGVLRRVAKLAGLAALGALFATELERVTGRRGPWTRLIVPLVAIGTALRTFTGGSLPYETVALLASLDAALLVFAVIVVVRVARREPGVYPEEALERELDRFTPGPFNRYFATELIVVWSALRFAAGGFRRPPPAGFSYARRWSALPLLIAMPFLTIPEMLALDLALWNAGWWRVGSDVVHVYAILWLLGIAATVRLRPHRCDAGRVRLRFGCLRRLDVERANVAAVAVRGTVAPADVRRLRASRDVYAMMLDGVPTVELLLRAPIPVRSLTGRRRDVSRIFVAADEPHAFAAALAL